jgi:thiol-disulfide isomerase/thioredoxin
LISSSSVFAEPDGFQTLAIGEQAPDFELPGVDDRQYTLKDFADAKLLLVIFTCNHCPTAQAYEERIMQLHSDYKDKGVALVAICPNDDQALRLDELGYTDVGDSFEDMKLRATQRGFEFPYLFDGETLAPPGAILTGGGTVIVAAGPWIAELVPELNRHLTLTRQAICWYQPKRPELFVNREPMTR